MALLTAEELAALARKMPVATSPRADYTRLFAYADVRFANQIPVRQIVRELESHKQTKASERDAVLAALYRHFRKVRKLNSAAGH